ncbi:hypothetical protein GJ496_003132 [Pomphorhynchus laevis]|nr:hypothetical protein GJ496_003132 [Pomphorhynchus laevis]
MIILQERSKIASEMPENVVAEEEPLDLSIKRKIDCDDKSIFNKRINSNSSQQIQYSSNKAERTKHPFCRDYVAQRQQAFISNVQRHISQSLPSSMKKSITSVCMPSSCITKSNFNYDNSRPIHNHQRTFRGQQAWLSSECSPLRQILCCLICNESFNTLEELTKHLTVTKHYDLEHKNIGKHSSVKDFGNVLSESKRQYAQRYRHCCTTTDNLNPKGCSTKQHLTNCRKTSHSCALDGLQEFVKNNIKIKQVKAKDRTYSSDISDESVRSFENNSVSDLTTDDDMDNQSCLLNSYEQNKIANVYYTHRPDQLLLEILLRAKFKKLRRTHGVSKSPAELKLCNWYRNRRIRKRRQAQQISTDVDIVHTTTTVTNLSRLNFAITPVEYDRYELSTGIRRIAMSVEDGTAPHSAATNSIGKGLFDKYINPKCTNTGRFNLSKEHLVALRQLRQMNDVVIKPSDKGGEAVVWQTTDYINEAQRQLCSDVYTSATITDLEHATMNVSKLIEKYVSLQVITRKLVVT